MTGKVKTRPTPAMMLGWGSKADCIAARDPLIGAVLVGEPTR